MAIEQVPRQREQTSARIVLSASFPPSRNGSDVAKSQASVVVDLQASAKENDVSTAAMPTSSASPEQITASRPASAHSQPNQEERSQGASHAMPAVPVQRAGPHDER